MNQELIVSFIVFGLLVICVNIFFILLKMKKTKNCKCDLEEGADEKEPSSAGVDVVSKNKNQDVLRNTTSANTDDDEVSESLGELERILRAMEIKKLKQQMEEQISKIRTDTKTETSEEIKEEKQNQ